MTFSDVFKSSFLSNINSFSTLDVLLALGLSFVLGLFIFFVYKKTYQGVMYSDSFGVSLIAMSMITSLVIIAVTSNVVLSLGMVGALSIVRFRTAVKDPMDLLYLFWAITSGITAGARMYLLAIIAAVIMIGMIYLFYNKQQKGRIYICVIHYTTDEAGDDVIRAFGKMKYFVKSKTMRKDKIEMAIEVFCKNNDMHFLEIIRDIDGVEDATLIQYNGEYHG